MQTLELTAQKREHSGKGHAHKLRAQGRIPAVLYGAGRPAVLLTLDARAFGKLATQGVSGHLVRLRIDGEGTSAEHPAIVQSIQRDPIKGEVQHVDFHEVALDKPIRTVIPLVVHGEDERPAGTGVVQHLVREIEIECLPTRIPDSVIVDVSKLGIGESIHLGQLALPDGVKLVEGDPQEVVVTVVASPKAEADEAGAAAAEAAEA